MLPLKNCDLKVNLSKEEGTLGLEALKDNTVWHDNCQYGKRRGGWIFCVNGMTVCRDGLEKFETVHGLGNGSNYECLFFSSDPATDIINYLGLKGVTVATTDRIEVKRWVQDGSGTRNVSEPCLIQDGGPAVSTMETINEKEFIETCAFYLTADEDVKPEKREISYFDRWFDGTNFCYTEVDTIPLEDGSNLINIENYTKMASENLGSIPVIQNDIKTKKGRTIEVCGGAAGRTVTLADLATITAAEIAALPVAEAGYEWAIVGLEVNQHPAKKKIYCDLADEEGTVASNEQAFYGFGADVKQYITIGDSKDSIVKPLPDADACGCLGDRAVLLTDADFTTPLTLAVNTGVEICVNYACVVVA